MEYGQDYRLQFLAVSLPTWPVGGSESCTGHEVAAVKTKHNGMLFALRKVLRGQNREVNVLASDCFVCCVGGVEPGVFVHDEVGQLYLLR